MKVTGDSGVQATLIALYFIGHPGCCRACGYKHNIGASVSPTVPEIFQCADKIGTLRIHPRHFVDEYDFFTIGGQRFQIVLKRIKSIVPSGGFRLPLLWVPINCPHEILYLHSCRCFVLTDKCKIVFIVEKIVDEICFAYTTATAYNYEFRTIWFQAPLQLVTFSFSGNEFVLHTIIFFAKIAVLDYKAKFCPLSFYLIFYIFTDKVKTKHLPINLKYYFICIVLMNKSSILMCWTYLVKYLIP